MVFPTTIEHVIRPGNVGVQLTTSAFDKWRSYACRTSIGDAQPQVDVPLGVVEKNRDALGLADGKVEALWHTGVEPLDMVVLW